MPSGLSRAKTTLKGMFKKKQSDGTSASTEEASTAGDEPSSLSPTSPSAAPQLEHPNKSSTGVNSKNDGAADEPEEDMTAAVLSAGDQVPSDSRSHGKAKKQTKENEIPSGDHGNTSISTRPKSKDDKQVMPTQPDTPVVASNEATSTIIPPDNQEQKQVVQDAVQPQPHTQVADESTAPASQETRQPSIPSESVKPEKAATAAAMDDDAPPATEAHSNVSEPTETTPPASEAVPTAPSNAANVRRDLPESESTNAVVSEDPAAPLAEPTKPTEQEIDDVEKREAQAAVEASKAPAGNAEAQVDGATSKDTGDVVKSVAANAGAAGQSMGMSATSGPIDDMPAV